MFLFSKIILFLFFIFFVVSFVGFYITIRPSHLITKINPGDEGIKYENIEFKTADGITLKGWYIPAKNHTKKTIVVLHGYPADKGDILPSRLFLHEYYNLLFFDFRYFGESGGNYSTIGHDEVRDVRAAVDYLKSRDLTDIAVWGLSMGAATALMSVKNIPEMKALIAETPYARLDWMADDKYPIPGLGYIAGQILRFWGLIVLRMDVNNVRPIDDAANIHIPLLLLFSKDDQLITYKHALAMQEAVKNNPNVQVIIYSGKQHGESADNYQQLVGDFFEKYFPPQ